MAGCTQCSCTESFESVFKRDLAWCDNPDCKHHRGQHAREATVPAAPVPDITITVRRVLFRKRPLTAIREEVTTSKSQKTTADSSASVTTSTDVEPCEKVVYYDDEFTRKEFKDAHACEPHFYFVERRKKWEEATLEEILSSVLDVKCARVKNKEDMKYLHTFSEFSSASDISMLATHSRCAQTALLYLAERGIKMKEASDWCLPHNDKEQKKFEDFREQLGSSTPEPSTEEADAKEQPVQDWLDVDVKALNMCRKYELKYFNDSGSSSMNPRGLEMFQQKGPMYDELTWTKAKIDGLLADPRLLEKGKYHFGSVKLVIEAKRRKGFTNSRTIAWGGRVLDELRRFNADDAKDDDDSDVDASVEWKSLQMSSSAKVCLGQCAQRFFQKLLEALAVGYQEDVTLFAVATLILWLFHEVFRGSKQKDAAQDNKSDGSASQILSRSLHDQSSAYAYHC